LKTEGPSSTVLQIASFSPGGHNGWHSHPGIVVVTLTAGSIEWYDADCKKTVYKAGDSWAEGGQTHYFRSTSTTNIQLTAAFFISKGSALRIDQPAPPCAASLGLD
ncbi:MAG TPA: cupin domain-containing protein, partial [Candidatus Sulfotelmatobacter sp.]